MRVSMETIYVLTRRVYGLDLDHDRAEHVGKYRVVPMDYAAMLPTLVCVVDDFGNLVRVS